MGRVRGALHGARAAVEIGVERRAAIEDAARERDEIRSSSARTIILKRLRCRNAAEIGRSLLRREQRIVGRNRARRLMRGRRDRLFLFHAALGHNGFGFVDDERGLAEKVERRKRRQTDCVHSNRVVALAVKSVSIQR